MWVDHMAELRPDQQAFLTANRIPLSAVFDASGLSKSQYSPIMKSMEKWVAIGVTPCNKFGHQMRTRAGHCMQCNELAHVFLQRHINPGEVYIAGSNKGAFIKIGTAKSSLNRINSLNSIGYGGVDDWKLILVMQVKDAGLIEFVAQKSISEFAYPTSYLRDGKKVECVETFRCKYSRAKTALLNSLPPKFQQIHCDETLEKFFDSLDEERGEFQRRGNTEGGATGQRHQAQRGSSKTQQPPEEPKDDPKKIDNSISNRSKANKQVSESAEGTTQLKALLMLGIAACLILLLLIIN